MRIERRPLKFKSKPERRFAAYLDILQKAGDIDEWRYEEWRFRVGTIVSPKTGEESSLWYTPDFVTIHDDMIAIYEVKGYMRVAARVRLGAFRDRFPFFDLFLVKGNGGRDGLTWDIERM